MDESIFDRNLDQQLCFEVYRAANGFSKMYGRALKPFELTFPQYLVLLALWDIDGIPIKNIGERLGMGIGTLNPILNRLEKQGWLTKNPSQEDKRSVVISLTEKGKQSKKDMARSILEELKMCDFAGIEGDAFMKHLKILNREFAAMEKRPHTEEQAQSERNF